MTEGRAASRGIRSTVFEIIAFQLWGNKVDASPRQIPAPSSGLRGGLGQPAAMTPRSQQAIMVVRPACLEDADLTRIAVRDFVLDILETVSLALLIFFLLQSTVRNYRVELSSMEPTLSHEDRLVVNKLVYFNLNNEAIDRLVPFWDIWEDGARMFPFHPPQRSEVIVFRYPHDPTRDFVKRVIGLPGETVSMQRGVVYIDGDTLDEPYLLERDVDNLAPVLVPPNSYFVMGDNRRGSSDSRHWGPVPMDNVVGKVVVRYWPFSEFALITGGPLEENVSGGIDN